MRRAAVTVMAAGLLLAGCGSENGGVEVGGQKPGGEQKQGASELRITVKADQSAAARTWTLRCDPPGGDHPDPAAACAAIAKAQQPFAAVAQDQICPQVYGGPQTATVEGTWNGQQVSATYKRTDGCEIKRWEQMAPVFQTNTGVAPSS
jgi:Subtilisin inhibitor-like